jgi:ketopantoate reductase
MRACLETDMLLIGAGRLGTSLAKRSEAHGIDVTVVARGDGWAALDEPVGDPVVVATRNDDRLEVIERVPDHRREDLVFIQNGMIRGLLRNNHLVGSTRGVIYFAATARDGDIQPGGTSWFCGPHAVTMARWLGFLELKARAVDWARFSYYEYEKLAWICLLGPLCEKHGCTVGEAVEQHGPELEALVVELHRFGRVALNVDAPPKHVYDRLVEYSRSIPDYRASVKEWAWRNGAVLALMAERSFKLPLQTAMLVETGHKAQIPPAMLVR